MKSFTDLFIKRPVLALVVSFVILIAGLQAMRTINVRQYPRSDIAAITITTVYVGADAELVRGFITTPLERAIAAADGIDYIQSQSKQGQSVITARLKLNYDANKALSDISSKVDAIRRDLPPESEIPVIEIQSADSQRASAYLSFTSDILQPNEVTDYLVRLVQPRLTAVGGVQKADILGGRYFAMRIWMKPDRMAALNISPAQVRTALARNNYLAAVGSTKGSLLQVNLTANTDLHTADDFKKLVVRQDKGTLVRLGDIAEREVALLLPLDDQDLGLLDQQILEPWLRLFSGLSQPSSPTPVSTTLLELVQLRFQHGDLRAISATLRLRKAVDHGKGSAPPRLPLDSADDL